MDEFLGWLLDLTPWHWFAVAVVLIGVEVMATTAYLLFAAFGTVVTGIVLSVNPELDWRLQMLVFAVVTVVGTLAGRRRLRAWLQSSPPEVQVNVRGKSFIGQRLTLEHDLPGGRGHVHVGDTWWLAETESGEALAAGTIVEITGIDSTTLKVRRIESAG